MIQLALAVITPANQCPNFSGQRIHRHQRNLHVRRRLSRLGFFPRRVFLGQQLVHLFSADLYRGGRGALQLRIERGVNAEALRFQILLRKMFEQMILDHVHKIRRGAAARPAVQKLQFLFLGVVGLLLRDVAVLDHLRQHPVSRFFRALRMPLRRSVTIRRPDNSAQKRALPHAQLAHVLAKIRFGRFAESANRKTAAIPQVDFVRVQLKNLLLRIALVDFHRHQHFFHFAAPFALRRKKETPRHLHINRTGALRLLPPAHIGQRRTEHPHDIQTAMLEETLILRGQHRVHHILRQVFETHDAPFLARAIEQIGDDFRLQIREIPRLVVAHLRNLGHRPAGETHIQRIPAVKIRILRRANLDARTLYFEFARRPLHFPFLVAGMQQISTQVGGRQLFAGINMARRAEDPRSVLVNRAAQPLVDQLAKLDVVIREDGRADNKQKQDASEDSQPNA